MSDRFALIARKNEVRQQIEQVRRQLEAERAKQPPPKSRLLNQFERQLEQLMAEESALRVAIDRHKAG
jgi:hypothetical protein